jgi:N-glycosylase/DNA lyase
MKGCLIDLYIKHQTQKIPIRERLAEFKNVPTSSYFYELAFCLLTPQSSARTCNVVIQQLKKKHFQKRGFDPRPYLHQPDGVYVRFHNQKAKRLLELRRCFSVIAPELEKPTPTMNESRELREWLVANVNGLGYKEATHFLRNIGKNNGLAILDRHILRRLVEYGALDELPKTISEKTYLDIEQRFIQFGKEIGIPVDELDLLFWWMGTGEIFK